ncbi:hypothetical protein FIBSPDRAFT_942675 [Athelia psychrophila]|uniref:Uncharacterized protein n=1 Tax=Athelia psychrophila TaxID=1759441 RepID=A0A166X9P2_9AGAM|nr:hypothetical protein FIBSPDRAFT_942675 [Fibularhizoctonia sp. CBS 109695]
MFDFWLVVKSWGGRAFNCTKCTMSPIKSFGEAVVQTIRLLLLRASESLQISMPDYVRTAARPATAKGEVLEMQNMV